MIGERGTPTNPSCRADEILRRDIDWFKLLEYDLIACDEAHKVKNSKGK